MVSPVPFDFFREVIKTVGVMYDVKVNVKRVFSEFVLRHANYQHYSDSRLCDRKDKAYGNINIRTSPLVRNFSVSVEFSHTTLRTTPAARRLRKRRNGSRRPLFVGHQTCSVSDSSG